MKRIFLVVLACAVFFSCKNNATSNGTGSSGSGSGNGTSAGFATGATLSEIYENTLAYVLGKTWTTEKNQAPAGAIGGNQESAIEHSIYFDKSKFVFKTTWKDGGIGTKAEDLTANEEYAKYVTVSNSTNDAGTITFDQDFYIDGIYLPKLHKFLEPGGKADDGVSTKWQTDWTPEVKLDNPFDKYYADGYHTELPNVVLNCYINITGSGSGRFRQAAGAAHQEHFYIVIKDGKMRFRDTKLTTEAQATKNESIEDCESRILSNLAQNYFLSGFWSDWSTGTVTGAEFTPNEAWPEQKQNTIEKPIDATGFRANIGILVGEALDTTKMQDFASAPN